VLSDDDVRYIREQLVPLADLCGEGEAVRSRVAAGELPAPPYPGLELVPRDYLELPEAAAYPEEERASFLDGSCHPGAPGYAPRSRSSTRSTGLSRRTTTAAASAGRRRATS
jgi:hypothetical protein